MGAVWWRMWNMEVHKWKCSFMRLRVVVAHGRILFYSLRDNLSRSRKRQPGVSLPAALRSDRHSPPTIWTEELQMTTINLKDFYPWYTHDEYIEVSEEVADELRASKLYEAA